MEEDYKQRIIQAHERIRPYIHRTPILTCSTIQNRAGCSQLYFKCENLQKLGAFKVRGGFNKIMQLKNPPSIACDSSGNHGQGVAYVGTTLKIPSYIVMPFDAPSVKKEAVKGYGGTVIESGNTSAERTAMLNKVAKEHDSVIVHADNDYDIITGQATVAKEIFQDLKDLDYLLFPIGGCGLGSGSVLSTIYFGGKCRAIGVESYLARETYDSIVKGVIQPQYPPITIADGLRTNLGEKAFSIVKHYFTPNDIILVTEEEIVEANKLVMERMKIVIEPNSATVVAALLKDERFRGKKVCCILSGGNLDMTALFNHLKGQIKQ